MYKAERHGKVTGISGKEYRFFEGQTIDAPNGDLYYSSAAVWTGKAKEKKPKKKKATVETVQPDSK